MANHQRPKKRRARKAVLAGVAAAGVSGALVMGQTADVTPRVGVTLANTVIGVGGRDDSTSLRLKDKLKGNYALGFSGTYVPIEYPANVLFQSSIDDALPKLSTAVATGRGSGDVRVATYSEGTLVAEQLKRNLATSTVPGGSLDFVFMASPYLPNGGIFARLPGFQIPGLLPEFGPAQATKYDSTYVTNEYDGFADFPAYFNLLSMANAFLGMAYAHPDPYYDAIDLNDPNTVTYIKEVTNNGAGGTDKYVLVYNPHLPLLAPLRQFATLTGLTALTEPTLSAIEPFLRVTIDMGYTDRTNANPAQPTPFSFFTPPEKIIEANAATKALLDGATSGQTPAAASTPGPNAARAAITPTPLSAKGAKDDEDEKGEKGEKDTKNTEKSGESGKEKKGPQLVAVSGQPVTTSKNDPEPTRLTGGNLVSPTVTAGTPTTATGSTPTNPTATTATATATATADGPSGTTETENDAAA